MPCTPFELPGGIRGIACSRTKGVRPIICSACGQKGDRLCDWKVPGGTCDVPMCKGCSIKPAKGKDLCLKHGHRWFKWNSATVAA